MPEQTPPKATCAHARPDLAQRRFFPPATQDSASNGVVQVRKGPIPMRNEGAKFFDEWRGKEES